MFLRKLAVALDTDFAALGKEKRPRTLEERLEMLIRKAVPDVIDEQVVVALLARGRTLARPSAALNYCADAYSEGVFNNFDLKTVKETSSQHSDDKKGHERMVEYIRGSKTLGDKMPAPEKSERPNAKPSPHPKVTDPLAASNKSSTWTSRNCFRRSRVAAANAFQPGALT